MDYGKIVTRAFEITRKHRALWLFGILLALFGGGGGGGNANFNVPSGGDIPDRMPTLPFSSSEIVQLILLLAVVLACFALVWIVLSIVLRFISRAALIGLVQELEAEQKTPTIRRGFSIGAEHFWRLLGIALVINIPLAIFSLVLIVLATLPLLLTLLPLLSQMDRTTPREILALVMAGGVGSLGLICCAALVLMLVGLIIHPFYQFITRACVIQKIGVMDSIRTGYQMVRANLSKVAVLYILAIGIGLGFGLVMIPIILILIAIPAGVGFAVYAVAQSVTPAILAGILVGIPMLLILIFISGLYQTFESTYWTLGYRAIKG